MFLYIIRQDQRHYTAAALNYHLHPILAIISMHCCLEHGISVNGGCCLLKTYPAYEITLLKFKN